MRRLVVATLVGVLGMAGCTWAVPGSPRSLARTIPIGQASVTVLPISLDQVPSDDSSAEMLLLAVTNNGPGPVDPDPRRLLTGVANNGSPAHIAPTLVASTDGFPGMRRIPSGQTISGTVIFDLTGGGALHTIGLRPAGGWATQVTWNAADIPQATSLPPSAAPRAGVLAPD